MECLKPQVLFRSLISVSNGEIQPGKAPKQPRGVSTPAAYSTLLVTHFSA